MSDSPIKVFLASTSPRRHKILLEAGIPHVLRSSQVDESLEPDLLNNPHEAAKTLAQRKAQAVVEQELSAGYSGDAMFIGADTMVVLDNEIYGKPKDAQEAKAMLVRLSGRTHSVITAVSIWLVSAAPTAENNDSGDIGLGFRTFYDESYVTFKPLREKDIDAYIKTGEPFDKAGGYGIQGYGKALVEKYEGSLNTIIGLPIERILADFGDMLGFSKAEKPKGLGLETMHG